MLKCTSNNSGEHVINAISKFCICHDLKSLLKILLKMMEVIH